MAMASEIRHIATRFALILARPPSCRSSPTASSRSSRSQRGTRESVVTGNQNVADPRRRGDPPLRRQANAEILKALAADLQDTGLEQWQQDRILKNYVLQFREFREITLFDETGAHDRDEPRRPAARRGPDRRAPA